MPTMKPRRFPLVLNALLVPTLVLLQGGLLGQCVQVKKTEGGRVVAQTATAENATTREPLFYDENLNGCVLTGEPSYCRSLERAGAREMTAQADGTADPMEELARKLSTHGFVLGSAEIRTELGLPEFVRGANPSRESWSVTQAQDVAEFLTTMVNYKADINDINVEVGEGQERHDQHRRPFLLALPPAKLVQDSEDQAVQGLCPGARNGDIHHDGKYAYHKRWLRSGDVIGQINVWWVPKQENELSNGKVSKRLLCFDSQIGRQYDRLEARKSSSELSSGEDLRGCNKSKDCKGCKLASLMEPEKGVDAWVTPKECQGEVLFFWSSVLMKEDEPEWAPYRGVVHDAVYHAAMADPEQVKKAGHSQHTRSTVGPLKSLLAKKMVSDWTGKRDYYQEERHWQPHPGVLPWFLLKKKYEQYGATSQEDDGASLRQVRDSLREIFEKYPDQEVRDYLAGPEF